MKSLLLRCAWCGAILEPAPPGAVVSHGICVPCAQVAGFVRAGEGTVLAPAIARPVRLPGSVSPRRGSRKPQA